MGGREERCGRREEGWAVNGGSEVKWRGDGI